MLSVIFKAFWLFCVVFQKYEVSAQVSLSVTSFVEIGEDTLRINCRVNSITSLPFIKEIRFSKQSRRKWNSGNLQPKSAEFYNETDIVSVRFDEDTGEYKFRWHDDAVFRRAEVEGEAGMTTTAFLRLLIHGAIDCTDEGYYTCYVLNEDDPNLLERTKYITVNARPTSNLPLTSTVYQGNMKVAGSSVLLDDQTVPMNFSNQHEFTENTTIAVKCTAMVGRPAEGLQWCMRRAHEEELLEMTYNSISMVESGSTKEDACLFTRTSYLFYDISEVDNGTELICIINNAAECHGEFDEDLVSRMEITVVPNSAPRPGIFTVLGNTDEVESTGSADTLVPGILLIIVGLIALVIAAYLLVKVRKLKIDLEQRLEREKYEGLQFRNTENQSTYQAIENEVNTEPVYVTPDEDGSTYVAMD